MILYISNARIHDWSYSEYNYTEEKSLSDNRCETAGRLAFSSYGETREKLDSDFHRVYYVGR